MHLRLSCLLFLSFDPMASSTVRRAFLESSRFDILRGRFTVYIMARADGQLPWSPNRPCHGRQFDAPNCKRCAGYNMRFAS